VRAREVIGRCGLANPAATHGGSTHARGFPPTFTDEGIRVAAMLRERESTIGVVILSSYAEPDFAFGPVDRG
jgi:hypothetical protein